MNDNIIRVAFREPPLENQPAKTEFYFGSIAAIYELFTPKQIGCRVERLWSVGLSDGNIYANKYCVISREEVVRKAQKSPSRRRKSPW